MPVNKVRRRGSYAPLSAHYYKDDALLRAGEKAEVLYVRGLAFCADVLSDGDISEAQLQYVGLGLSNVRARARKLVEVGLWERVEGGYVVRSWLTWNKSRESILGDAKKDADRKGSQAAELPFPPEPPPEEVAPDHSDSERNPDGLLVESGGSPNGFRTGSHARGSARAPSNSRATPGQLQTSSSPTGQRSEGKPSDEQRSDVQQLCQRLAEQVEANGSKRPTINKSWRDAARLLLDRDGRDLAEALRLIDWCQADEFWHTNVLSLPKFREKYDQLRMKSQSTGRGGLRAVAGGWSPPPEGNWTSPAGDCGRFWQD